MKYILNFDTYDWEDTAVVSVTTDEPIIRISDTALSIAGVEFEFYSQVDIFEEEN